jgi:hypothetical protein
MQASPARAAMRAIDPLGSADKNQRRNAGLLIGILHSAVAIFVHPGGVCGRSRYSPGVLIR